MPARAPNFQPTAGKLAENLEAAGIDPAKITKVVFTHGHADHLWGAIDDFDDSERFPNASYVISADRMGFLDAIPTRRSRVPDWLKGMARGSARILKRSKARSNAARAATRSRRASAMSQPPGTRPATCRSWWKAAGERLLIGGDVLTHAGDVVRAAGLALGHRLRPRPRGRDTPPPARPAEPPSA